MLSANNYLLHKWILYCAFQFHFFVIEKLTPTVNYLNVGMYFNISILNP